MGLTISHDAFRGTYSGFHRVRQEISRAAEMPPLDLMEGFFSKGEIPGDPIYCIRLGSMRNGELPEETVWEKLLYQSLPIRWDSLKDSPLHEFLHHSDCEGEIESDKLLAIAGALEELLGNVSEDYQEIVQALINGMRKAFESGEPLAFG